ncbi:MAG: hypothetical protein ACFFD1_05930 [Candidatus Thorarchaeota archaeon]
MGILDEIASNDPEYYERTIDLCKNILNDFDSTAGLGALRIILKNFPKEPKEGSIFLKLLINYLKGGLSEVKPHIIYGLEVIIQEIPEIAPIIRDIDFVFDDEDPNVRTAMIQTITNLFTKGMIPVDTLVAYLKSGIIDIDYVVRILSVQSLNNLLPMVPNLQEELPYFLEIGLQDQNSDVFEESYAIYQKNYDYLLKTFPNWVDKIKIDIT